MKNKIILSIAILTILYSFKLIENTIWRYDSAHAKLGFTISHLMVSDVDGSFKKVDATIISSKADFSDAVVEMTAQVNSVSTGNERRDAHLQTPDYFDAAKYPTITFKSTSFKKANSDNTYTVVGNLTMHGITKPITLTAIAKTVVIPSNNKTIAGFKLTGKLNRKDFGIAESNPAATLGEEVNILVNAEFIKQ